MGINTIINWSKIGRFCSIGRNVDIGGVNHNYSKVTTMTRDRFMQLSFEPQETPQTHSICEIGNDVWIAAGVNILNKVKIGDGAVIGAGAVVTHNVPPYATIAGVPGKIIGYRCDEKYIQILESIKWWNWPINVIMDNIDILLENDICEKTIDKYRKIAETLK